MPGLLDSFIKGITGQQADPIAQQAQQSIQGQLPALGANPVQRQQSNVTGGLNGSQELIQRPIPQQSQLQTSQIRAPLPPQQESLLYLDELGNDIRGILL